RLDGDVRVPAADLRLLSSDHIAGLAAASRVGTAANLRVRRHARADDRSCVPRRPDAASPYFEWRLLRGRSAGLPETSRKCAAARCPDANRGIADMRPGLRRRARGYVGAAV